MKDGIVICRNVDRKEIAKKSRLNLLARILGKKDYHASGEEEGHA